MNASISYSYNPLCAGRRLQRVRPQDRRLGVGRLQWHHLRLRADGHWQDLHHGGRQSHSRATRDHPQLLRPHLRQHRQSRRRHALPRQSTIFGNLQRGGRRLLHFMSVFLFFCLFVRLSSCLSVCLPVCLSFCLSIFLISLCSSSYLSVLLSVCLCGSLHPRHISLFSLR